MFTFKMFKKTFTAATLAEASAMWSAERDRLDFGASKLCGSTIYQAGEPVAEVSYNGKVWPFGTMARPATVAVPVEPLFNPYA